MRQRVFVSLLLGGALSVPLSLAGQPRASERGTVSQIVNGTTIVIDFSRPVARGRDNLFGGVVHWGETWTPGANWATTIAVDKPIELNGHAVPAGKYSVWMQPQPDEWTVFLNRQVQLYHDSPVPAGEHLVSFTVVPEEGAHMETLAWYFPVVEAGQAEVRMHWGTTYVPMAIVTEPYEAPIVGAADHAGYVGTYEVSGTDPTVGHPLEVTLGILEEDGHLVGRWGRAPIILVPADEGEFYLGFTRNGELFDLGDEMTLRMVVQGDRASAVEMLWYGEPFARGDRVP